MLTVQQRVLRLCVLHVCKRQLLLTSSTVTADPTCAARAGQNNMLLSGRGKRPKVTQRGLELAAAASPMPQALRACSTKCRSSRCWIACPKLCSMPAGKAFATDGDQVGGRLPAHCVGQQIPV